MSWGSTNDEQTNSNRCKQEKEVWKKKGRIGSPGGRKNFLSRKWGVRLRAK